MRDNLIWVIQYSSEDGKEVPKRFIFKKNKIVNVAALTGNNNLKVSWNEFLNCIT